MHGANITFQTLSGAASRVGRGNRPSGPGAQQESDTDPHEDDIRGPGGGNRRQEVGPGQRQCDVVNDKVASHDRNSDGDAENPTPAR